MNVDKERRASFRLPCSTAASAQYNQPAHGDRDVALALDVSEASGSVLEDGDAMFG